MIGAIRLQLYHRRHAGSPSVPQGVNLSVLPWPSDLAGSAFCWATCLRSIALVPEGSPLHLALQNSAPSGEDAEWLNDEHAYARLLELICGLHSPLIGETEVFGQFKTAAQQSLDDLKGDEALAAYRSTLNQWLTALVEDAKIVRQKHLQDLGSQSYGSLVRREIRLLKSSIHSPQIDVIGAGQLAQEILPWVLKESNQESDSASAGGPVTVFARNVIKAKASLQSMRTNLSYSIESLELSRTVASGANSTAGVLGARVLIVAAPLPAQELQEWVERRAEAYGPYDLVIDLRGESRQDEMASGRSVRSIRSLGEIFESLGKARDIAAIRKKEALELIRELVHRRATSATHRPFGWDDVWS